MKIYYIVEGEINLDNQSSVLKKVIRQTRVWVERGYEVLVFSVQSGLYIDINKNELFRFGKKYTTASSAFLKLLVIWSNTLQISKFFEKFPPDIIYTRLLMYTFYLELIAKKYPVIIEINSYDKREYKGKAYSKLTQIYTTILGDRLKRLASGFVFVTDELATIFLQDLGKLPVFKIIGNGYDFSSSRNFKTIDRARPKLIFLISPGLPWHGLDRLTRIVSLLPEFDFHVVGETGSNSDNLFFHGYLNGENLDNILADSDIGIASLALDRIGLEEACPLKSREYLSYGLPCIGGYIDTDFNGKKKTSVSIFKNITNIENLDESVEEIRLFVNYWMNRKPYKNEVKNLAFSLLDDSVKEDIRLSFFKQIIVRKE